ncbi:MAG: phosphate ABC transporter permease subunit PstC [Veillonellaceae bacterium]|nr:phosphate ABC transporter permease subunit PstC [Veillonellaceae bacterium]
MQISHTTTQSSAKSGSSIQIITSNTELSHRLARKPQPGEQLVKYLLLVCGLISILTTLGIVFELGKESLLFFRTPGVDLIDFLTKTEWQPSIGRYGVLPLLTATLVTSLIAMLVAIPLGLTVSIYLSEYASDRARAILKPVLEVLAGIPTIVYGYFALTFVTPILRDVIGKENVGVYNMLSAGLVMGVMILPLISSISEDALHAVPHSLREAAFGLGATRLETAMQVVVPAAFSGIIAAIILGISRAIGETMIVAVAAGSGPAFTFNPLKAAETMTGYIARISGGDLGYDIPDYNSIFAIGLLLFLVTMTLNLISRQLVARFREVYE